MQFQKKLNPVQTVETIQAGSNEALPQNIQDAEQILNPSLFKSKEEKEALETTDQENNSETDTDLELGKPLPFTKKERHSFTEWLQLTSTKTEQDKPWKKMP